MSINLKTSTVPKQVVGTNKRINISHLGVEVLGDLFQAIQIKTSTLPTQVIGTNKRTNVSHLGVEVLGDMIRTIAIYDGIGSGGIGVSGNATFIYNETGSGGVEILGDMIHTIAIYDEIRSGGIVASGKAVVAYNETGSGGVVTSGKIVLSYFDESSGGIELSGLVLTQKIIFNNANGGITTDGISVNNQINFIESVGGCGIIGITQIVKIGKTINGENGCITNGNNEVNVSIQNSSLGGVFVNGSVTNNQINFIESVGGCGISGITQIAKIGKTINGENGCIINGNNEVNVLIQNSGLGGVFVNGSVTNNLQYNNISLGGLSSVGESDVQVIRTLKGESGVLISGLSFNVKFTDNFGTGSIKINGNNENTLWINSVDIFSNFLISGVSSNISWIFSRVDIIGVNSQGSIKLSNRSQKNDITQTTIVSDHLPVLIHLYKDNKPERRANESELTRWKILKKQILNNEKPENGSI